MEWFKGSIVEAISLAKEKKYIFIVYIYDKSDLSSSLKQKLDEVETLNLLQESVAIQLENGSNEAKQFAEIYPLILIPSLYFINPQTGVPLEVVGGNIELADLTEKINKIKLQVREGITSDTQHKKPELSQTSGEGGSNTDTKGVEVAAVSKSASKTPIDVEPDAKTSEQASEQESSLQTGEPQPPSLDIDERVERAKDLLQQRQQQKKAEEMEEEKKREVERRRQMQELLLAKQKKDQSERNEIKKQRNKEKEEDRIAREKVKAQIAADREEKKRRAALISGETPPSESGQAGTSSGPRSENVTAQKQDRASDGLTRIKFRFPDNSSELAMFDSSARLSELRAHLIDKSRVPFSPFKLVGTLPSRTFVEADMQSSLVDLGLVPSSIVIVKPATGSSSGKLVPTGVDMMSLLYYILSPFTFLYSYVARFFSSEPNGETTRPQPAKRQRTNDTKSSSSFFRDEANNVHRLRRSNPDDDDENNTWNGNSTQQM